MKKMIAYQIYDNCPTYIRNASKERDWMDETQYEYAYRCLPLTMANQHGWEICLKENVQFIWNGGDKTEDIKITGNNTHVASSIFGHGIVTFHIGHVFYTDNPYNLFISGTPNFFVTGIQALSGVFESNWAPYTFTMNWKILEPNRIIRFKKNDPICFVFPIDPGIIEEFTFSVEPISKNPELEKGLKEFNESRKAFITSDKRNLPVSEHWQKHYFQGKYVDGTKCPFNHRTKVKMKDIEEETIQQEQS